MFSDLVKKTRSYRRFDAAHQTSEQEILSLIELARLCPSAANLQQLRFAYSMDKANNDTIFRHLAWAGYLRYWNGPEHGERPTGYIILLSPTEVTKFHLIDTGIMAQTMMLGATEMGLGGCQIASVKKEDLRYALGLPEEYDIVLVLAIGKPAESIIIEDITDPQDIEYWRDDMGVHHVPKRSLEDLIVPLNPQPFVPI